MKNDVQFNVLIKKETNRFVVDDYYVAQFFTSRFVEPMAFFNGPNWYIMKFCIKSKYGIEEEESLDYIKSKLYSRFKDEVSKEGFRTIKNPYKH